MKYFSAIEKQKCPFIFSFLLFVCLSLTTVYGQAQGKTVTLKAQNEMVEHVFSSISKQIGVKFFYDQDVVKDVPRVTLNVVNASLNNVLDKVALQTKLVFNRDNNTITVGRQNSNKQPVKRTGKVSGRVVDDTGEPIIGANVLVKGTTNGVITDFEGNYTLINVDDNAVIQISYIGYKNVELKVGSKELALVKMREDSEMLSEVVVVGYGSQKKVNLTGAVEQVTSEVFEGRPTANVAQMLEGAVPNLNITLADGKPGRSSDFNVRGAGSINGGSALVLIDGVEGDPSMLNPNDIESVSVLKDAAASSIYGARAPFGVVLITTKNATAGKPKVTYSSTYSLQTPQNVPDLVTDGYVWAEHFYQSWYNYRFTNPSAINKTQEFSMAWLEEYKRRHDSGNFGTVVSDGSIGTKGRYVYYPEGTDYYDLLYKDHVFSQNQNISISGSDGKFDYYLSGRFYSYDGLFNSDEQTDTYNTYNLRFKGGYQATPWLKISNNMEYNHNKYYNPINYSAGGSGVVWRNLADEGHPSSPLFNPDGSMTYSGIYSIGELLYGKSGITTWNTVFKNTTSFQAKFFNNKLRINGDFTFKKTTWERLKKEVATQFARSANSEGASILETVSGTIPSMSESLSNTEYLATNIFAEFEETFAKKHYFKAMAGWNYEQSKYKYVYAKNDELLTDDVINLNLAMGTDNKSITSSWSAYKFGGAFFRLNYAFDNRYLLEVNGRYDVSSRFPSNERWAFFPSASVGWRITEEPWLNINKDVLTNAKVRFSYGQLGNANGLSDYQYKQTLGVSTSSLVLDGLKQRYMSSPAALPGSLTWETAATYDVGVDLGLFNNRLTLTGDYYIRKTTDMIVNGPTVPDVFGASTPKGNYADMSTYGYEVSVEWRDKFSLAGKPFNYSIKATLADYYSEIDKFNNATYSLSSNANQSLAGNYYEGMRLGEIWGFVSNGLWQTQSDIDAAEAAAKAAGQKYYNPLMQTSTNYKLYPGDIKFEDLNGNGYIDRGSNTVDDPGDRIVIGNEEPRYIYSFSFSGDWNNIWFSAFFQGVGKQDWYPSNESSFWGQYNRPYNMMPTWHLNNYWTEDNPDAYLPRYAGYYAPFYKGTVNANTRYLMNAAYLRLKNIQIGYNLPQSWIKKLKLQQVGIYLSGENLFTWSPLYKHTKDINVSNIGDSDTDLSSSRGDGYNYPMMKSYSVGLNITF